MKDTPYPAGIRPDTIKHGSTTRDNCPTSCHESFQVLFQIFLRQTITEVSQMIPQGSPVHLTKFGKVEQSFQIIVDGQESDVLKRHFPVGHHCLEGHTKLFHLLTGAKQIWSPIDGLLWVPDSKCCHIQNLWHYLSTDHGIDTLIIEVLLGITEESGILKSLPVEPLRCKDTCCRNLRIGIMVENLLHVLVVHHLCSGLCSISSSHSSRGLQVDINTVPSPCKEGDGQHLEEYNEK